MPEDVIYKLALIMALGQEDFGTDDLADHFLEVKDAYGKPDWAIAEMMGKATLADYFDRRFGEAEQEQHRRGPVDVYARPFGQLTFRDAEE